MATAKSREDVLRRVAERRGMRLEKSKRKDRLALDYGTYHLVDAFTNTLKYSGGSDGRPYGLTLADVEEILAPAPEQEDAR
jgi:hypothetical protein